MTFKGRIAKIETSLEAKKKVLLWLQRAKAAGGWMSYQVQQLKGPLVLNDWLADADAYFLWHLVIDVNSTILSSAHANRDLHALLLIALTGVVWQVGESSRSGTYQPARPFPEIAETVGKYVCAKFKKVLEEELSLAAAIIEISKTYLDGEDVLFPDSRAALDAEISKLRETAVICNALANWLDAEPVAVECLTSGHQMVDAKVRYLVNIARAEALPRNLENHWAFIGALEQACPGLLTS